MPESDVVQLVQQAALQEIIEAAHRREPGRLLLPQHLLPHGHLQIRALRDRLQVGLRVVLWRKLCVWKTLN